MRILFCFLFTSLILLKLSAQSTAFIIQGGPSMGTQRWDNSFERNPLFRGHAALTLETLENEADRSALFMQLGYHVKGSATRFTFFTFGGGIESYSEPFLFKNISLLLGAKMKRPLGQGANRFFYFGGIRGDYTLDTNIDELGNNDPYAVLYYPQIGFMNRWMFGVSAGTGVEFSFSQILGGQIMLGVHPDVTLQYNQPPSPPFSNPYNPGGQPIRIDQRRIRNITIELSFGLRLIRRVKYVDEE